MNNLNKKADDNKFDDIAKIINSADHGKADKMKYLLLTYCALKFVCDPDQETNKNLANTM